MLNGSDLHKLGLVIVDPYENIKKNLKQLYQQPLTLDSVKSINDFDDDGISSVRTTS